MAEQERAPERRKRGVLAEKRQRRRRKLQRKRRALEALPESCIAYTARRMLWDCDVAIRAVPVDGVGSACWRNAWLTAVTLLRAIGHVLKKEDAIRSAYLKQAVESAWTRWKDDIYSSHIFFGFVEDERNALLKQYQFWTERKIYSIETEETVHNHLVVIGGQAVSPETALRIAWKWWQREISQIEGHAADLRQLSGATRTDRVELQEQR